MTDLASLEFDYVVANQTKSDEGAIPVTVKFTPVPSDDPDKVMYKVEVMRK